MCTYGFSSHFLKIIFFRSSCSFWLDRLGKERPACLTITSLELPESSIPLIDSQANGHSANPVGENVGDGQERVEKNREERRKKANKSRKSDDGSERELPSKVEGSSREKVSCLYRKERAVAGIKAFLNVTSGYIIEDQMTEFGRFGYFTITVCCTNKWIPIFPFRHILKIKGNEAF